MIRNIILVLLIIYCSFYPSLSQTRLSLSLSQSASNDWKTSEVMTIEAAAGIDTRQHFSLDTLSLDIALKIAAGVLKESYSGGNSYLRPTDNDITGEAILKYPLGWAVEGKASKTSTREFSVVSYLV